MSVISNFSTLRTGVAAWLNRSDLAASVPSFIQLGERKIYRDLRVSQMETALSAAITTGVVAVPAGYLEMKFAYVDGEPTQTLSRKNAEWIYSQFPNRSAQGKPIYFAREGANFIFGPFPNGAFTVKGVFYKKLTELSDANPTNWLIVDAPDLILFASLLQAAPYLQNDPRLKIWNDLYEQAKDAIQGQDRIEAHSGSRLQATAN